MLPGPVAVASLLKADLGWVILFGAMAGFPAMLIGGVLFGKYISKQIRVGVPEHILTDSNKPEEVKNPPAFGQLVFLISLPLALILLNTVSGVLLPEGHFLRNFLSFLGHPFTALMIAALLSFYVLGTRRGLSGDEIQRIATKSLEPVGLIILVTGAGGVFGKVLVASGVGKALANLMATSNLPIILLAFLIAVAVRVSQGSATVSMVTAAGIMEPFVTASRVSAPMLGLITIAIASGATVLSHVNDSGFWLVSRYLGLSEKQTLRSWTILETILGGVGFLVVFILSFFF